MRRAGRVNSIEVSLRLNLVHGILAAAEQPLELIETVGVGQSEIEIAGLADTTVVVVVPEAGDEIQTMKSGIMEVADVFVVNKSDREGADTLLHALKQLVAHPRANGWQIPVVKATASMGKGLEEVLTAVNSHRSAASFNEKRLFLLALTREMGESFEFFFIPNEIP